MNTHVSKNSFIIICILGFLYAILQVVGLGFSNNGRIVFCDVGQGDGAYIRTKQGLDIVIDAGVGDAFSTCLYQNMPYFDTTIELAILSHPQIDHYGGFMRLQKHYYIQTFIIPPVLSESKSYKTFIQSILQNNSKIEIAEKDTKITIGNTTINILWPEKITENNGVLSKLNNDGQVLGLYTSTTDPNWFSSVLLFTDDTFNAVFTGDMPITVSDIVAEDDLFLTDDSIEIVKIPHHGSKNGITKKLLTVISPDAAVISVGKKNSYGHPSQTIMNMLSELHIPVYTTAQNGDIVFEYSAGEVVKIK